MVEYKNEDMITHDILNKSVTILTQRKGTDTLASVTIGVISSIHLDQTNTLHVYFNDGNYQTYQIISHDVEVFENEESNDTNINIPHHHMSGEWRHFKGGTYEVLTVVQNQTSGKKEVLYLASGHLVVRDLDDFMGNTTTGTRRFTKV